MLRPAASKNCPGTAAVLVNLPGLLARHRLAELLASNRSALSPLVLLLGLLVGSPSGMEFAYTVSVMADKILAKVVRTGTVNYHGVKRFIRATAQLSDLGQGPYFSVTGEIGTGPNYECCGCIHDEIAEAFPDLAEFIKWHCAHIDRGPWYYQENALYWAGWQGHCDGKDTSPPNAKHLASTVVWGALPGETAEDLTQYINWCPAKGGVTGPLSLSERDWCKMKSELLRTALTNRHAALMDLFHSDMVRLFEGQVTATDLATIRAGYEKTLQTA